MLIPTETFNGKVTLFMPFCSLFFFLSGGGGGGWADTKKNSCTPFVEEIKLMLAAQSKRNILQASEIKFIQGF